MSKRNDEITDMVITSNQMLAESSKSEEDSKIQR
jgi:hypothetical protein